MGKVIVLGGGMVGSAMAVDMSRNHRVTVADMDITALGKLNTKYPDIATIQLDIRNKNHLQQAIETADLIIGAVPGWLGFETVKTVIESGKDIVDISFFPENALELDQIAKENHVTAIVDCGVAPGMGNIILGYHNEHLKIESFECLVGGLPKNKIWPFNYKAPFSPADVIEEYTRPARYVEHGKIITKPPLSDRELVEFEKTGTLEAFNSDGLRSLLFTMAHIPDMKEKTLRYPGHAEYIRVLKDSGFFSTEPLQINGVSMRPVDFTSRILFDVWRLEENEEEFTIMKIRILGTDHDNRNIEIVYDLYDEYDPATGTTSMARTTGYTATAAANLVLDGIFQEKGIFPPELLGRTKVNFDYIMNYLRQRGVVYKKI